jgi:hypothetical protein
MTEQATSSRKTRYRTKRKSDIDTTYSVYTNPIVTSMKHDNNIIYIHCNNLVNF